MESSKHKDLGSHLNIEVWVLKYLGYWNHPTVSDLYTMFYGFKIFRNLFDP